MTIRPKPRRVRTLFLVCAVPISVLILLLLQGKSVIRPINAQGSEPDAPVTLPMSSEPVWIAARVDQVTDLAWGDVDNDGDLDLIVGTSSTEADNPQPNRLYLNDEGQFGVSADWFSRPGQTNSVVWADINRDGWLDLVVGNDGADELYLNEQGELATTPIWQSGHVSPTSRIVVGDVNGDGWYDLVAAHLATDESAGTDVVYLHTGRDTEPFYPDDGVPLADSEGNTLDLTLADADGDQFLDLVTVSGNALRLYRADGTAGLNHVITCPVFFGLRHAQWGPTGDGSAQQLALGGSDPLFGGAYTHVAPYAFPELTACDLDVESRRLLHFANFNSFPSAWADVDGDGLLDIATAMRVFLQQDDSAEFIQAKLPFPVMNSAIASWADVDGDGDLDVIVAEQRQPLRLFYNEQNQWQPVPDLAYASSNDNVLWGDIDNDGDLDRVRAPEAASGGLSRGVLLDTNENGEFVSTSPFRGLLNVSADTAPVVRTFAWGDVNDDAFIDIVIGTYGQAVQLYQNDGQGSFLPEPLWFSDNDVPAADFAWGDVDADGYLDLAIGTNSAFTLDKASGRDLVYRFNPATGLLDKLPWWQASDISPTAAVRWIDFDQDGDLDLVARDSASPLERIYLNDDGDLAETPLTLQSRFVRPHAAFNLNGDAELYRPIPDGVEQLIYSPANPDFTGASPLRITIIDRNLVTTPLTGAENIYVAPTDPPSLNRYYDDGFVTFFYEFTGPGEHAYDAVGFYSIDGGMNWLSATPTAETVWQQLQPGQHVFTWNIAADGLTGRNDDVRFRLQLQPRSSIEPMPNTVPGTFQQPHVQAETMPFRVFGKQIRVVAAADTGEAGIENAVAYLLSDNSQTALLMGNTLTGQPFTTNASGFLSGRGRIVEGDKLLAMLPVTQAYRIPPQLIFDANSGTIAINSLTAPSKALDAFSAEMWLYPTGDAATLIALGDNTHLSYQTISDTTTISLTVAGETTSTDAVPLRDGSPHHLAFSWSAESGEVILYADGEPVVTNTTAMTATVPISRAVIGDGFEGTLDEIRLWDTVRRPITETIFAGSRIFATSGDTLLASGEMSQEDATHLIGYWPITEEDGRTVKDHSGNGNDLQLSADVTVAFKPLYTLYHTSGAITSTVVTSATNGVMFTPVTAGGVQTLTVSADNPLILFDLDVSLEWDARNDLLFLQQLADSFQDASALLYDITDGQVALGQINLFHDKAYWGSADIVIRADNSLRPSAAIGGVVNAPVDDPGNVNLADIPDEQKRQPYEDAYFPGQIRMGTSWDPYGEHTADLGVDWSRALAHELAHYLLFLPDNYLGIENGILRRIYCPDSFMTTTNNPAVSELLYGDRWDVGECPLTLAQELLGRNDWQTVLEFYPMLRDPEKSETVDGPSDLPLAVTYLLPWGPDDKASLPFADRNFDIRNSEQQRQRLPNAQVFLFKTYSPTIATDDVLIPLGTPTGGGDRIAVRGAEEGDRLCLFGAEYSGCIDEMSRNTVTIPVVKHDDEWHPEIGAQSDDGRTVAVTIDGATRDAAVCVQLFPMHYRSTVGNAPIQRAEPSDNAGTYRATFSLPLPAYEIAVRVWQGQDNATSDCELVNPQDGRELIDILLLNPPDWDASGAQESGEINLKFAPLIAGPNSTIVGGPNSTIVGGPNSTIVGGPNSTIVGGAGRAILGNPNSIIVGGPNSTIVGGPNSTIVGGGNRTAGAPISSADAQLIIYNSPNIFDENGVASVQSVTAAPCAPAGLVAVGQSYRVVLEEFELNRFIALSYLQRDVPPGYEYALGLYFLPESAVENCDEPWRPVANSESQVENLIVAELQQENGTYGLFVTIPISLTEGWNLFSYPLPVTRTITQTLLSIEDKYDPARILVANDLFAQVSVTAGPLNVRSGQSLRARIVGQLPLGTTVSVLRLQNGWWEIACPGEAVGMCWISSRYTTPVQPVATSTDDPVTVFEFGQTYFIYVKVEGAHTLYLAPPVRGADGTLEN
ncbi:MAG: FG-GAP-like repeat-containing protein [Anaerolineae bacterium]|nr:FG-GAP-like repeat-containing protein [Anaerolineae bacterium]